MAVFPTSVPTDSDLYIAINTGVTALTAGIDNVTLTIPVTSTAGFPAVGFITIDGEIIKYTSIGATQFNASQRGADGTAANSHLNGAQVNHFIIAAHHNVLKDEIVAIAQNLSDRIGLGATQLKAPDGTNSVPSYSFASNPDTGLYLSSPTILSFVIDGSNFVNFNGTTGTIGSSGVILQFGPGSAALPAYGLSGDTNTGMYGASADELGFATNGINRLSITTSALNPTVAIRQIDGSATAPSYSFASESGLGLYRAGASSIGFAFGTVLGASMDFTSGYFDMRGNLNINCNLGSATIPSITFQSDLNTGIYHPNADEMSITTGGVERVRFKNAALEIRSGVIENLDGTAALPAYSFANDTDTGIYRLSANELRIATNATARYAFGNGAFTLLNGAVIQNTDGSVSIPAFSFDGDQDTGFYRVGTNEFAASVGSVQRVVFSGQNSSITTFNGVGDGGGEVWQKISREANVSGVLSLENQEATTRTAIRTGLQIRNYSTSGIGGVSLFKYAGGYSGDLVTGLALSNSFVIVPAGQDIARWAWHFGSSASNAGLYFTSDNAIRAQIHSSGTFYGATGSAGSPAISFVNDPDSGLYSFASNEVSIACGGAERLRVSTSNGANDIRLLVWDHTANALVQVSRGAADSGGAGFRVLRVPN